MLPLFLLRAVGSWFNFFSFQIGGFRFTCVLGWLGSFVGILSGFFSPPMLIPSRTHCAFPPVSPKNSLLLVQHGRFLLPFTRCRAPRYPACPSPSTLPELRSARTSSANLGPEVTLPCPHAQLLNCSFFLSLSIIMAYEEPLLPLVC